MSLLSPTATLQKRSVLNQFSPTMLLSIKTFLLVSECVLTGTGLISRSVEADSLP